jgi:CheY-like chemotaxis protein
LAQSVISGIRGHCVLTCESAEQALVAVRQGFAPDVALVDTRIAMDGQLVSDLVVAVGRNSLPCVALRPSSSPRPSGFDGELTLPATAREIELTLETVSLLTASVPA